MDKLVCVADFEQEAHKRLDKNALDHFKSGADAQITLAENPKAFKRWIIRPRVLRDVSIRDLSTKVLGKKVGFPIGISPVGQQKLAHEDGEIASARAAASMNTIYIMSTASTTSIEDVARASPNGRKWFQLYVYTNRNITIDLIRRAEANGFEALVFTVDATLHGYKRDNVRNKFRLPAHLKMANFEGSQFERKKDPSLTWDFITWLKSKLSTTMPIILKGIHAAADAKIAILHEVSGILVSNHGGRQLDTVQPTIEVLEEIINAVNGRCEVYLDSGITSGTDIFKALALGAKMVFAGRPFVWGLAVGGEDGVRRVLEIFKEELDLTMALTGVKNVSSIDKNYVAKKSWL